MVHKRDILFLLIGAVVATGAASCFYKYQLQALESKFDTKLLPTVRARRNIPSGRVLTLDDMTVTHEFDQEHLPASPLDTPWIGVGRAARRAIPKGEFVDYSDVFPRSALP